MKDRNSLIAVPVIRTILMSLMCSCLLLFTSLPAIAQDKKDSKPSTSTQKNTDGTTTTTETYDWGTKATTKDSIGTLIDTVTTERNDKFGKGGTKAKIESHKNGNDIDTVVYKDKSGKVRRAEKTEFSKTSIGKYTFDVNYDETGRITSYAFGNLDKITDEGKVEYDEFGRPLTVMVNQGAEYRISYKYEGANDKTGSKTVETYDRQTKKWNAVPPSRLRHDFEKVLEEAGKRLAAIREATERHMSIVEDISPIDAPDVEAPKPKKNTVGAPGKIDPCLVGTWRSEPGGEGIYGSGGIVFTVKPDGMAAFDYDGMKPSVRPNQFGGGNATLTTKVTGKASGQISSEGNKSLSVADDFTSSVTEKETNSDGTSQEFKPRDFFPAGRQGSEYTCTKDTLTLFAEMKFKKVE